MSPSTLLIAAVAVVSPWPAGVHLPAGRAVDEAYRQEFATCDREDRFSGHAIRGCRSDPNAVTALRRLPGGEIAYASKLAVDLDGSPFACSPNHGRMDQCPTSLMLPDGKGGEVPVDADTIPYVVIPFAGPRDVRGRFTKLTGVDVGDFGYVQYHGVMVPVIVADTGPFAKLGEGSIALHRALGRELCSERGPDTSCTRVGDDIESIGDNVVTVLFPGSARHDLTPANLAITISREVRRLRSGMARAPS
ncbi:MULTISPECIES: glycoside hydrolase family 75 protein [unclassified Sphingomonas]|uniref:glycoside hydrolase family 75 protein n=1 Tax=unclassified Sphingomonas TaxID=196159 RepID=UPI002269B31B|nr:MULTISPECIES: glycoside hydrolase family 75 protein [unclassified Sphingomonas]